MRKSIVFLGIFVLLGVMALSPCSNKVYAEDETVDVLVKFSPALEQMGAMSFKLVTTGRTIRKTIDLDGPYSSEYYKNYNLMNYIYVDRALVTAMFYQDDNPQYYKVLTLVIDEDTLRAKMRDKKLFLLINADSIEIK